MFGYLKLKSLRAVADPAALLREVNRDWIRLFWRDILPLM